VGEWDEAVWLTALADPSEASSRQRDDARTTVAPLPIARREVHQVRGILAERVIVSTLLDPFLTLKALAAYSGIGLRKLYDFLSDPIHPLPHYRVGGKLLVRRSEFDAWIARYRQCGQANVDSIVDDVLRGLNSPCSG